MINDLLCLKRKLFGCLIYSKKSGFLHQNKFKVWIPTLFALLILAACSNFLTSSKSTSSKSTTTDTIPGGAISSAVHTTTGKAQQSVTLGALSSPSSPSFSVPISYMSNTYSEALASSKILGSSDAGLGWTTSSLQAQVIRINQGTGNFEDDKFRLYLGTTQYALTYQCTYGDDACTTLHPNDYAVTSDTNGSYDIKYYVTNQADFSVIKHIVNTKDTGQTYSTWKMTNKSGMTYLFGGYNYTNPDGLRTAEKDISDLTICKLLTNYSTITDETNKGLHFDGSLQSGCKPGSVKVGVRWSNWIGPNDFTAYTDPLDSTAGPYMQSQFSTAWNLSVIRDQMGQETNLYWAQNTQNVGLNGAGTQAALDVTTKTFVRDSYLYKVEAANGDRLRLNYCRRVGGANVVAGNGAVPASLNCEEAGSLPTEFFDWHMENQEPDAFQEMIRTLYLKSVDLVLNQAKDTTTNDYEYVNSRTELSFSKVTISTFPRRILTEINTYVGQQPKSGDGTLTLVKSQPPTLFCYGNYSGGACSNSNSGIAGMLSSVMSPSGALLEYSYEALPISNDDTPISISGQTDLTSKVPVYGAGYTLIQGNRKISSTDYFDVDLYDSTPTGWKLHKSIFGDLKLTAADDSYYVNQNIIILPNGFVINTPDQKVYWVKRTLGSTSKWEEPVRLASDIEVVSMSGGADFIGLMGSKAEYMIYNTYDYWQTLNVQALSGAESGGYAMLPDATSVVATMTYVSVGSNYLVFWRAGTANVSGTATHTVVADFFYKTEEGTWTGDVKADQVHLTHNDKVSCSNSKVDLDTGVTINATCEAISVSTHTNWVDQAPYIKAALSGSSVAISVPVQIPFFMPVNQTKDCKDAACSWYKVSYGHTVNSRVYTFNIPIDFKILNPDSALKLKKQNLPSQTIDDTFAIIHNTHSQGQQNCTGQFQEVGDVTDYMYGYAGSALVTNNGYYQGGYRQSHIRYETYGNQKDCKGGNKSLYTTPYADYKKDFANCTYNSLGGVMREIKTSDACQGSLSVLNDTMISVTASGIYFYYGLNPRARTLDKVYGPTSSDAAEASYTLVETSRGMAAEALQDLMTAVGLPLMVMDPVSMAISTGFIVAGTVAQNMASAGFKYNVHWSQPHLASMASGGGWYYQGNLVSPRESGGSIGSGHDLWTEEGELETAYFGSLYGYIPFVVNDGTNRTLYVQRLMNFDAAVDGSDDEWIAERIQIRKDALTASSQYTTGQYNPVVKQDKDSSKPVRYESARGAWDRDVNLSGPGAFLTYETKASKATSFYGLASGGEYTLYRMWNQFDASGATDYVVSQVTLTDGISQSSNVTSYVYDATQAAYSSSLQSGIYGQVAVFPGESASDVNSVTDAGTYGKTIVTSYYGSGTDEDPLLLGNTTATASYKADGSEYLASETQYQVRQYSYDLAPKDGSNSTYTTPIRAAQVGSTTTTSDGIPATTTYGYTDYNLRKSTTNSALKYNPVGNNSTWKSTSSTVEYAWENSTYANWVLGKNRLTTIDQSTVTYQEMPSINKVSSKETLGTVLWENKTFNETSNTTSYATGQTGTSAPSIYYGGGSLIRMAYVSNSDGGIYFTFSKDDGETWSDAVLVVAKGDFIAGTSPSISFNSAGASYGKKGVYIAYNRADSAVGLFYSSNNGVDWRDLTNAKSTVRMSKTTSPSLAIAPIGYIYASWQNNTNGELLAGYFDSHDGVDWQDVTAVRGGITIDGPSSLAMDTAGTATLIYSRNKKLYSIRGIYPDQIDSWYNQYKLGVTVSGIPNLSRASDTNYFVFYMNPSTGELWNLKYNSKDGASNNGGSITPTYNAKVTDITNVDSSAGVSNTFRPVGSSALNEYYTASITSGNPSELNVRRVSIGSISQGSMNGCILGRDKNDTMMVGKLVSDDKSYYCTSGATNAAWKFSPQRKSTGVNASLSSALMTPLGKVNVSAKTGSSVYRADVTLQSNSPLCWTVADSGLELTGCSSSDTQLFAFLDYTISVAVDGFDSASIKSSQLAYHNNSKWQCLGYDGTSYLWQSCGYEIIGSADHQSLQIPLSFTQQTISSVKDELTTSQQSTTFEWCKTPSENGGMNSCQSTAPTPATAALDVWVMLSQAQQVSKALYTKPSKGETITTSKVTERDPDLLVPIETQDTFGTTSSIIYSNNDRLLPISNFKNASMANHEAGYIGFETYETATDYTVSGDGRANTHSHTGQYSYGASNTAVSVEMASANSPSDDSATVVSVWVLADAGKTCSISIGGATKVTSSTGTGKTWEYLEYTYAGLNKTSVMAECGSGGYIDDFRFSPVGSGFEAIVYATSDIDMASNPYWQVQQSLSENGGLTESYYDSWYRPFSSFYTPLDKSSTKRMGSINLSGLSRLSGYGTYNKNYVSDVFSSTTPNSLMGVSFRNSRYDAIYKDSNPDAITLSEPSFALRGLLPGLESANKKLLDASTSIMVWNSMSLTYDKSATQYSLSDNSNTTSNTTCYSDKGMNLYTDWLFVVYEEAFFFFGDGKNVMSCTNLKNPANGNGKVTLNSISSTEWTDVSLAYEPIMSLSYADGFGRSVQMHRLGQGADIGMDGTAVDSSQELVDIASGLIYDNWGHVAVTSMSAVVGSSHSDGSTRSENRLTYFPDLVAFNWSNNQLAPPSGVYDFYSSSNADDAAYAFLQNKYEASPSGRMAGSVSAAGKQFSFANTGTNYKTKIEYQNPDEQSIASNLKLTGSYEKYLHFGTSDQAFGGSATMYNQSVNDQWNTRVYSRTVTDDTSNALLDATIQFGYQQDYQGSYDHVRDNTPYISQSKTLLPNYFDSKVTDTSKFINQTQQRDTLGLESTVVSPDITGMSMVIHDNKGRIRFAGLVDDSADSVDVSVMAKNFSYWRYDAYDRVIETGTLASNTSDADQSKDTYTLANDSTFPSGVQRCVKSTYTYDYDSALDFGSNAGSDEANELQRNWRGRLIQVDTNMSNIPQYPAVQNSAVTCIEGTNKGVSQVRYGYDTYSDTILVNENQYTTSGTTTKARNTGYVYDNQGTVLSIAYPDVDRSSSVTADTVVDYSLTGQTAIYYTSDELNRLDGICDATEKKNGELVCDTHGKIYVSDLSYTFDQLIASRTMGNGVTEGHQYDFTRSLIEIQALDSSKKNLFTENLYYGVTNDDDAPSTCGTPTYDRGFIVARKISSDSVSALDKTECYTYDVTGRLTQVVTSNNKETFTYDSNGNMLTDSNSDGSSSVTYKYKSGTNQIDTISNSNTQFEYNKEGSVMTMPVTPSGGSTVTNVFTRDYQSQRTMSISNENCVVNYSYDGLGHRVKKDTADVTTNSCDSDN